MQKINENISFGSLEFHDKKDHEAIQYNKGKSKQICDLLAWV